MKNGECYLSDSHEQAQRFARVREAHSREIAEDYLELIYELQTNGQVVRPSDISRHMGVSRATVTRAVARLREAGLVVSKPYRALRLSEAGEALAKECRERHVLIHQFLLALGVDDALAQSDAEGLEHHVGSTTLEAMRRFLNQRNGQG